MASRFLPVLIFIIVVAQCGACIASRISLGSRLLAKDEQPYWLSDNETFAFGFSPAASSRDRFQLAIWFAQLPGDRTLVWSPNM